MSFRYSQKAFISTIFEYAQFDVVKMTQKLPVLAFCSTLIKKIG